MCVRTGNNAAWLCQCERQLPLVGYSDDLNTQLGFSRVGCPDCGRVYRVVAPGLKQVPTEVREIQP